MHTTTTLILTDKERHDLYALVMGDTAAAYFKSPVRIPKPRFSEYATVTFDRDKLIHKLRQVLAPPSNVCITGALSRLGGGWTKGAF
jgi:hypothetical protein